MTDRDLPEVIEHINDAEPTKLTLNEYQQYIDAIQAHREANPPKQSRSRLHLRLRGLWLDILDSGEVDDSFQWISWRIQFGDRHSMAWFITKTSHRLHPHVEWLAYGERSYRFRLAVRRPFVAASDKWRRSKVGKWAKRKRLALRYALCRHPEDMKGGGGAYTSYEYPDPDNKLNRLVMETRHYRCNKCGMPYPSVTLEPKREGPWAEEKAPSAE